MEKSYIRLCEEFLLQEGFTAEEITQIEQFTNEGITKSLYTDTKDFDHDIKHIERVLTYVEWILNAKKNRGEILQDENLLRIASLYHDIGKTLGASDENHGLVGSIEAQKLLTSELNFRDRAIVSLLIKTHASHDDQVDFENFIFTEEEKKNIQLLSDILKDADALDRNRLNYPAPIGGCDEKKLRTKEAKEILEKTNLFLKQYNLSIIKEKNYWAKNIE